MKKITSILFGVALSAVVVLSAPVLTMAQVTDNGNPGNASGNSGVVSGNSNKAPVMNYIPNPLSDVSSISDLIYKVVQVVVDISYVVVAFFLLLAGFKFITAQGSETKLEDAKKTFYYTIIGAVLVIGAQVITTILQGVFKALK